MIKVKKWIKMLKYIEAHRRTFYDNTFPGNCGLIHQGGVVSFDCIGLVKSVINDPSIVKKTSPVGFYVKPGQVVPDGYGELQLLNCGTDIKWYFNGITAGESLYMGGHFGVFVGDFVDGSGTVNTIECTTDWGANGVTTSYTDPYSGRRFDHKGGIEMRSWEAHSKLTPYIDYSKKKKEEKSMFTDVDLKDEHYKIYKAVVDAGIMKKNSKGEFNPDKKVTRGVLAIVVYRLMKKMKLIK